MKLQAMVISLTSDGWWGLICNGAQVIDDAKNQYLMSVKMQDSKNVNKVHCVQCQQCTLNGALKY